VVRDRPDLEAARHRVEAAKEGIGTARASYLPHLNAFAEMNLDSDEAFSRKGESWTAGAMVTWDIFSGLQNVGAVRAARAEVAGAEAQARFREEEIVREVRQAHREVLAANAQVDVAVEAMGQADERLRITQLLYKEGLATATDLLGAEAGQTQSRVRRLQALHALNVGLAKLEFAVGSGIN
jgi:outer membrane protein